MSYTHYEDDAFVEALDYLYSFINLEKKRQDRYMAAKMDASRPRRFLEALGAPYRRFPSVHIAGTKGKGSVAAMCAYILRAAGYRAGLYTSPHLQDFRERIRILTPDDADGRIPPAAFIQHINQIKTVVPDFPNVTWFEVLTAVAFLHFARQQVDVAVVEVGLGGRLDATNVLAPLVSVITSLSIDHAKFLGHTLAEIAYEKGGIVKPGVPVVTAPQQPEALAKLEEICQERQTRLTIVGRDWQFKQGAVYEDGSQELIITQSPISQSPISQSPISQSPISQSPISQSPISQSPIPNPQSPKYRLPLAGSHQLENATVAIAALQEARPYLPKLNETAVQKGLASVQWPGRLQTLYPGDHANPALLVDCAHNPHSAHALRAALEHRRQYNRLILIFGAPADKDIPGMLRHLLPLTSGIVVTTANHTRSAAPEDLAQTCAGMGYKAIPAPDTAAALRRAWQMARPGDLICAAGSIIVIGDLLNQWERLQSELTMPGLDVGDRRLANHSRQISNL